MLGPARAAVVRRAMQWETRRLHALSAGGEAPDGAVEK